MKSLSDPEQVAIYHRPAVAGPDSLRKLEDCQDYCLSKWGGHGVVFDDTGLSGLSLKRPALRCMTKQVLAGSTKIIVIYDLNALGRDPLDLFSLTESLLRACVEIHVVELGGPIKSAVQTILMTHTVPDEKRNLMVARLKAGREQAMRAREGQGVTNEAERKP
jgi:DNA invertase Pin-like site-specific DNA recombinase